MSAGCIARVPSLLLRAVFITEVHALSLTHHLTLTNRALPHTQVRHTQHHTPGVACVPASILRQAQMHAQAAKRHHHAEPSKPTSPSSCAFTTPQKKHYHRAL